jgi:hypothetical protein
MMSDVPGKVRPVGHKSSGGDLSGADLERIADMFAALDLGDDEAKPSKYWNELNKLNVEQLRKSGFENFKRTIALNYFTWSRILPWDSQITFLCKHLPVRTVVSCMFRTFRQHNFGTINLPQLLAYNFLTLLLWAYLLRTEHLPNVLDLREPQEGNPMLVHPRPFTAASQDLANSILEFEAFGPFLPSSPHFSKC